MRSISSHYLCRAKSYTNLLFPHVQHSDSSTHREQLWKGHLLTLVFPEQKHVLTGKGRTGAVSTASNRHSAPIWAFLTVFTSRWESKQWCSHETSHGNCGYSLCAFKRWPDAVPGSPWAPKYTPSIPRPLSSQISLNTKPQRVLLVLAWLGELLWPGDSDEAALLSSWASIMTWMAQDLAVAREHRIWTRFRPEESLQKLMWQLPGKGNI